MILDRKAVELLSPAGTWDALVAGVESGADAVYLGGKHFNMRMHEGDFNFDDEMLKEAIAYAHAHAVRLYITLNNLISDEEIPPCASTSPTSAKSSRTHCSFRILPYSNSCMKWVLTFPSIRRS